MKRPGASASSKKNTFNLVIIALVVTALCVSYISIRAVSKLKARSLSEEVPVEEEEAIEQPQPPPRKHKSLTPEMAAIQLVRSTVSAHKVAVFSKSYCPYCAKAKAALSSVIKPDAFFVVELDQRSDGDAIQDALLEVTGGRSVPRVFVGGNFIGGGDDTARKAQNGELKQLLADAGVETL